MELPDLPEDLVCCIFLNLPVKSLIRFRCVSKGVCGMIDSWEFVKKFNHPYRSNYPFSHELEDDMCLIGCCNGVFCFGKAYPETYVLWNQSKSKFRLRVTYIPTDPICLNNIKFGVDSVGAGYGFLKSANFRIGDTNEKRLEVYIDRKMDGNPEVKVMQWVWANPPRYAYAYFFDATE